MVYADDENITEPYKRLPEGTWRYVMTETDKLGKSVETVQKFCPNFKTILKKNSKLHRAIGWILSKIGNPNYMSDYVTTIGQTTALPNNCINSVPTGMWEVILHEGQHAQDAAVINNYVFGALYLLPQLLGILGLFYGVAVGIAVLCGAPLALLWGLLALIFLAPLPALGRTYLEVRGYTISLAVGYWANDLGPTDDYIEWVVGIFTGPGYYYMFWPFKSIIRNYFKSVLAQLQTSNFVLNPYTLACKNLAATITTG
jgi:hypothetical protein